VRNLPLLIIEATSLGASSYGIPHRGADSISEPGEVEKITGGQGLTMWETYSSKTVDWKPIVLAYHNRKLVVPANFRMRVTL
jgi:hypothetical protein